MDDYIYKESRGIMGNRLTVSRLHDKSEAKAFVNEITTNGELDFNKIIPLSVQNEKERQEKWGSKYNAADTQIVVGESEPIKIMFNTSFVVFEIVKALSEKYPDLQIVYEYSDEYAICGGISEWENGKEHEGCEYPYKAEELLQVFREIWGRFPDFDLEKHIKAGEKADIEIE